MSTITNSSSTSNNSLIRLIVIGGLITGALHIIIQTLGVFIVILRLSTVMVTFQYVASGLLGDAAYTGGFATALLGLILEFVITTIIAAIFIFSASRIPLLRKNVIVGSLLYGIGVFIVMNFVVLPLSAAQILPLPPTWLLIEIILEHMLLIGLPLGIIVRRNDNAK